jgi:hypothetical protein
MFRSFGPCFSAPEWSSEAVAGVTNNTFSNSQRTSIERDNALRLLPRLKN